MQTIVNLIYTMAARNLEAHAESGMTDKYRAVAAVVTELQAAASTQLWCGETATYDAPHGTTFPVLKRLVLQVPTLHPPDYMAWKRAPIALACLLRHLDSCGCLTPHFPHSSVVVNAVWVQVVDCMFVESDLKSKWVRTFFFFGFILLRSNCFVSFTFLQRKRLNRTRGPEDK